MIYNEKFPVSGKSASAYSVKSTICSQALYACMCARTCAYEEKKSVIESRYTYTIMLAVVQKKMSLQKLKPNLGPRRKQ